MLLLHHREVLDLKPGRAPEVLPEPIHKLREMQRIQRRSAIVIGRGPRGAVPGHRPIGRQRQREKHARAVGPPRRRHERAPDGPRINRDPWQVRGVLPSACRPGPSSRG